MPSYLHPDVYDFGLSNISGTGRRFDICTTLPTTYTQATSTYSLGNKTTITVGDPQNKSGGGREVVVPQITGGTVTSTGTAAYWALTNPAASKLLAAGELSASRQVNQNDTFNTTTEFAIGIAAPA